MPSTIVTVTKTNPVPVPTDLVIDREVLQLLDSSGRLAPLDVFGGIVGSDDAGTANVFYRAGLDTATVLLDLTKDVNAAVSCFCLSTTDSHGKNTPYSLGAYPLLHVQLVPSAKTYLDYQEIANRVTQDSWTTNAKSRVASWYTDYQSGQLVVGVADLTAADVAAATTAFGNDVRLVSDAKVEFPTATTTA